MEVGRGLVHQSYCFRNAADRSCYDLGLTVSVQAAAVDLHVKQQPVLRIFIARYYFALHVDGKLENDAQFEAGHGIPKRPLMRGFRYLTGGEKP